MTDKLTVLAEARADLEEYKAKQKTMLEELYISPSWLDTELSIDLRKTQIDELEAQIEDDALLVFKDGGPKKQEGVTIKEFTVVKISDESQAREWCMTNFRPALKLDTKTFEKAAKDGTVPAELATVTTEPRAQIATDLSKYLPSAIPGPEQSR